MPRYNRLDFRPLREKPDALDDACGGSITARPRWMCEQNGRPILPGSRLLAGDGLVRRLLFLGPPGNRADLRECGPVVAAMAVPDGAGQMKYPTAGRGPMSNKWKTGASILLLALSLAGCTSFPDPANRAAVDGLIGAGIGALIGGAVNGGGGGPSRLFWGGGGPRRGGAGAVPPPP